MFSAQTFQIGRLGGAGRVGDGVVDIADVGGFIAAGEPARHIPAPDERRQHRRRGVARLRWRHLPGWRIGTICAVPAILAASSGAGSIAPPMITAGAVAANRATRSAGVDGERFADRHLPQLRGCRSPGASSPSNWAGVSSASDSSSAMTCTTTALGCAPAAGSRGRRSRTPAGRRRDPAPPGHRLRRWSRVRGSSSQTARGHRVQALVQRLGVGGQQQGLDVARSPNRRRVSLDIDMAAAHVSLRCAAPRRGRSGRPSSRSRVWVFSTDNDPHALMWAASSVSTLPSASAIADQPGPRDHRGHHAVGDRPGGEHLRHPRQRAAARRRRSS